MIESYLEDGACKAEEHIFGKSITVALYPHVFVEWIAENQGLLNVE